MSKLEQLTPNAAVCGILPDELVTVVSVRWFGSEAIEFDRIPSWRGNHVAIKQLAEDFCASRTIRAAVRGHLILLCPMASTLRATSCALHKLQRDDCTMIVQR
jgi:hypothetical protein